MYPSKLRPMPPICAAPWPCRFPRLSAQIRMIGMPTHLHADLETFTRTRVGVHWAHRAFIVRPVPPAKTDTTPEAAPAQLVIPPQNS